MFLESFMSLTPHNFVGIPHPSISLFSPSDPISLLSFPSPTPLFSPGLADKLSIWLIIRSAG